jgi:hypothetical protein
MICPLSRASEFWTRYSFSSFDQAAAALRDWERVYNFERFSMALHGETPAEKLYRCSRPSRSLSTPMTRRALPPGSTIMTTASSQHPGRHVHLDQCRGRRSSARVAAQHACRSAFVTPTRHLDTCPIQKQLEQAPPTPASPVPRRDRYTGRPGRATGLPCCQSPRAYVLRPLPRRAERSPCVGRSDRPRRPSSIERRLGARIQPFGACSGFTRVAARTLADPPMADRCPRGFDGSVAIAVSRIATKVDRHLLGPDFHRLR